MTDASAVAAYLRNLHTDRAIGEALMTLVRRARAGDHEARREATKAVEWLLTEWKG